MNGVGRALIIGWKIVILMGGVTTVNDGTGGNHGDGGAVETLHATSLHHDHQTHHDHEKHDNNNATNIMTTTTQRKT